MDKGMKFSDALRELGRRIRAVYGNEEEDVKIDPSADVHRL
jgi:hypothetical protein